MSAEALWLDGNAIAGLLGEVFGAEMTTADRGCGSCGAHSAVGAHRLYQGAGAVLRCPVCGDVALRIVSLPDRHVVQLHGSWTLDVTR
jgi:exosome complex RNA-binding protein Csl4